jgi:hypothetical protein
MFKQLALNMAFAEIMRCWGMFRYDEKEKTALREAGFDDAQILTAEQVNNAALPAWIRRKLGIKGD